MAVLIAMEGGDRVGKATQTRLLAEYIKQQGRSATIVEVPVHDVLTHSLIYYMLRSGLAKKLPKTFQVLQVINRFIFQYTTLLFYHMLYDYVIFDRWSLSTVIYGTAVGVDRSFNEKIASFVMPADFTIVINGPSRNKEARDSYEKDEVIQGLVRLGYSEWCRQNPKISREVSSLGTPVEVHYNVAKALRELLPSI